MCLQRADSRLATARHAASSDNQPGCVRRTAGILVAVKNTVKRLLRGNRGISGDGSARNPKAPKRRRSQFFPSRHRRQQSQGHRGLPLLPASHWASARAGIHLACFDTPVYSGNADYHVDMAGDERSARRVRPGRLPRGTARPVLTNSGRVSGGSSELARVRRHRVNK